MSENGTLTLDQIEELKKDLATFLGEEGEGYEIGQTILKLLMLEDKEFELLSPGILESYELSLNNPNDKLMLVKSFNASGIRAEDFKQMFDELEKTITKTEGLSQAKKDFIKQMLAGTYNAIISTEGIAKRIIEIPIEYCHENAKMPQYAHESDSGMDVFALEDITINPGETKLIPTGIKVALPPGYEIQVRPKSGRSLKSKLRISNTPGTIDAGYRDEIGIIVDNIEPEITSISYDFDPETHKPIINSITHGKSITIGKGEKIAQLVVAEVIKGTFFEVESVKGLGEDRKGGFGSTGLK